MYVLIGSQVKMSIPKLVYKLRMDNAMQVHVELIRIAHCKGFQILEDSTGFMNRCNSNEPCLSEVYASWCR